MSTAVQSRPGRAARKSAVIEYVALSGVQGLGDEGIAHILAQVRRDGGTIEDFYSATTKHLQDHYGLRSAAAQIVRDRGEQLRERAAELVERADALGVVVLAPIDAAYPGRLNEFYEGEPPLLYARGNLALLDAPGVAVLNSAKATAESLEHVLALASRLAEAGQTLVVGTESPSYNVVGLAAKRAGGSAIVVSHQGLLAALEQGPDREPVPLARFAGERLDPRRTLLVSPFRLDGRWQKGNGPRRDKLVLALAERIVAVELKSGGTMNGLCREAMRLGRRVFACQFVERPTTACANDSLIADGAATLVADSIGSNVDLVLAADAQRPSTKLFETDDLERRRSLGQFFTPPEVAQFIWEMVEVMRGRKWNRTTRLIDPACGEGVFVRVAIERGQPAENCFGVDIDETLVPVWHSDARLRGARLFRTSGLLDNPTIGLMPGSFDLVIGNPPFSGKGLRDLLRLVNLPGDKRSKRERSLFGDEPDEKPSKRPKANGPPVAAHERAVLDYLARQLSRYMCWRLRDESEEGTESAMEAASSAGGLFADLDLSSERPVRSSDYERMAQAVSAWPADRLLDTTQPEVRETIRRLASTAIEVFFTERFVQLAKPGGMVAVIVPESILASDQLGPLRGWLMQQIQLLAVVSLPQKVFTGVGANARTGVVFARRYTIAEQEANAKAEMIKPGCRMTSELKQSSVIMVSSDSTYPNWTLQEYFRTVIERTRKHHLNERKTAKT